MGVLVFAVAGCSLTPKGYEQERRTLAAAGAELRRPAALEELPAPAGGDDWRTLLRRALIANGDVRAAWFEWKAAVERVRGASSWPNSNISLGYSYLFSDEKVKSFSRSTFSAGFDAMENLSFPGKTMAAGRVALEDARSAAEKFRAAKFSVQRRFLDAWLDLAMAAEKARLSGASASLAAISGDTARAELRAGGTQGAAMTAELQSARGEGAVAAAVNEVARARAMVAALTATGNPAEIGIPTRLPAPRDLPAKPGVLLDAVEKGPQVRGLAADRRARKEEQSLAELQWIPDVNPAVVATGSIEQSVGAVLVLPTTINEIRSGIAVAKAMRGAATARLAQAKLDAAGEVRIALLAARDAERSRRLLEDRVLPAAISATAAARNGFQSGPTTLGELIETERLAVDVRMEIATSAIEREKQLAAIEEKLGADLETFTPAPHVYASARPAATQENPR